LLWTSFDCRFVSLARVFIDLFITGATGIDSFLIFQMCANLLYVEKSTNLQVSGAFRDYFEVGKEGRVHLDPHAHGHPCKVEEDDEGAVEAADLVLAYAEAIDGVAVAFAQRVQVMEPRLPPSLLYDVA
jgi:hypothetical protein